MNKKAPQPGVDWKFIRALEGWESKGYVPQDRDKNDKVKSGVTIAAGFDLGQHTAIQLKRLGLTPSLFKKLEPYCMVTGDAARRLLKEKPLQLTTEELFELDTRVKEIYFERVKKEYEDHSDYSFWQLDSAKQTVICSVAFQYGSLKSRAPRFFRYVTRGMWYSAAAELENFGDGYTKRRLKEAALLRSSLAPQKKGMV